GVIEGSNVYKVVVTDAASNSSEGKVVVVFDIAAPPAPTVTVEPYWNANSVQQLTVTTELNATFAVYMGTELTPIYEGYGAGAGTPVTVPIDVTQDKTYTFRVVATDLALNASQPKVVTVVRDTLAPSAPVVSVSTKWKIGTPHVMSVTAEAGSTILIHNLENGLLVGSAIGTGASLEVPVTVTQDKQYEFAVWARDAAGNVSERTLAPIVKLDTVAPEQPVVDVTPSFWKHGDTQALMVLAEKDAIIQVYYGEALVGSGVGVHDTKVQISLELPDGNYILKVVAEDEVGNRSQEAVLPSILVDVTPPSVPEVDAPSYWNALDSRQIKVRGDVGSTVKVYEGDVLVGEVYINSFGSWKPVTLNIVGEGLHNLTAQAMDAVGNVSASITIPAIELDTVPPSGTVSVDGLGAGNTITTRTINLTLTQTGTGGAASMSFSNDGTTFSTPEAFALKKSNFMLEDKFGSKRVWVKLKDAAGNETTISTTEFKFVPSILINNNAGATASALVTLTLNAPLGTTEMSISENPNELGSQWVAYSQQVTEFPLQYGKPVNTVYVKYRNATLQESAISQATALLLNQVYLKTTEDLAEIERGDSFGLEIRMTNFGGASNAFFAIELELNYTDDFQVDYSVAKGNGTIFDPAISQDAYGDGYNYSGGLSKRLVYVVTHYPDASNVTAMGDHLLVRLPFQAIGEGPLNEGQITIKSIRIINKELVSIPSIKGPDILILPISTSTN
ncbi:Ig-like domain-containing protein, partial [Paenibacillus koleovorans]|uniref:Ig-like domain-containing protein n=1 Tax=Paenibacillus koleovorans TaxID=121608 RepID=UPI0013E40460